MPRAEVSAGLHRPRWGGLAARASRRSTASAADRPFCLRQPQEARDECADSRRPFGRLLSASPALPGAVHDIRGAREHSNRTAQPPRTPRHAPQAAHPAHAVTTPQTHPANAATPDAHTNPSAEHDPAAPHDAHPPPPRTAPAAARPPLPLLKPLRQKHPPRPARAAPADAPHEHAPGPTPRRGRCPHARLRRTQGPARRRCQRRSTTRAVSSVTPAGGMRPVSRVVARSSGSASRWRASTSASRARPASMSSRRRSTRPSV